MYVIISLYVPLAATQCGASGPIFALWAQLVPAVGSAACQPTYCVTANFPIWPVAMPGEGLIPGTGHFHIIVDRDPSEALAEGDLISFNATHLHFGKGQVCAHVSTALSLAAYAAD